MTKYLGGIAAAVVMFVALGLLIHVLFPHLFFRCKGTCRYGDGKCHAICEMRDYCPFGEQ